MFLASVNDFREQPPYRPTVNWGNPLTRGLIVSLYNCPQDATIPPFNYVTGKSGTRASVAIGAPATVASETGGWVSVTAPGAGSASGPRTRINGSAKFNGSTSWAQLPLDLSSYLQITVAFWYRRTSSTDSVSIEYGPNFNPNGFIIDPQSSTKMVYATQGGSTSQFTGLSTQITSNEWHHHVLTPDRTTSSGLANWLIDGATASVSITGSSITTNIAWVSSGNLNLGARNGGASTFGAMEIAGLHIWNRQLSSAEALRVYREGWRMFNPVRRGLFPSLYIAPTANVSGWFLGA